ncbi:MAG: sulfate ABC transporter permease subunit CysW [Limnothrix sp.]|nr:sulfate ABC transporter permease subunit CysW [Limnothrix sp.]
MASTPLNPPNAPQSLPQKNFKVDWVKLTLIVGVAAYLLLVLVIPLLNVIYQALAGGFPGFWAALQESDFQKAVLLTLLIAVIVVPLNTVFGLCAAWALTRRNFPGRAFLLSVIDLPFSVPSVVAGLMLVLLYGREGWFGPLLQDWDVKIIFAVPGIVLASAFVTMPFVVREVLPVLEDLGKDQEEAARTLGANEWQIFWRVTLPSIRWSVMYGVILTNARTMGEFGAVAVVSGSIAGKTQTLPLYVEEAYKQYQTQASYTAALLLACLALVTLVLKTVLERQTHTGNE